MFDVATRQLLVSEAQYYGLDIMHRSLRNTTIVVHPRAYHRRVSEALQDARDGDTILVTAGRYVDSFVMLRSVHVVGEGPDRSSVLIQSTGSHCVECRSAGGSIRNVTIESCAISPPSSSSSSTAFLPQQQQQQNAAASSSNAMTTTTTTTTTTTAASTTVTVTNPTGGSSSLTAMVLNAPVVQHHHHQHHPSSAPQQQHPQHQHQQQQQQFGEFYCVLITEGAVLIEGCDLRNTGLSCVKIVGDEQQHQQQQNQSNNNNNNNNGESPVPQDANTPPSSATTPTMNNNNTPASPIQATTTTTTTTSITFATQHGATFTPYQRRHPTCPTLRHNTIHNASQCGVLLTNAAGGVLEGNEIYDNRFSGIELRHGAVPTVRDNHVHDNRQNGVYIHSGGLGSLSGNTISRNQFNGINVEGPVRVVRNCVTGNAKRGIYHAHDTVLVENEVSGNALGDVALK
eukprot:PhM_4_TR2632/c0_g1_i1/m.51007/K10297/FBXO11; F-box protein 11